MLDEDFANISAMLEKAAATDAATSMKIGTASVLVSAEELLAVFRQAAAHRAQQSR